MKLSAHVMKLICEINMLCRLHFSGPYHATAEYHLLQSVLDPTYDRTVKTLRRVSVLNGAHKINSIA